MTSKKNCSSKEIYCGDCNKKIIITSNRQKFCEECRKIRNKNRCKQYYKKTYVKRGYNQKRENNNAWKGGTGWFGTLAKQSGSLCNRCKSSNNLGVHHKDRNRSNNEISNLEVLCARCHRIEHECWKNLPKGEELSRLKYIQSLFAKRKNGRFSR